MTLIKTSTAKRHSPEESRKPDRPATAASRTADEILHLDTGFTGDASEKLKTTGEGITRILEQSYSTATKGAADFNRRLIEMVRINTNSNLDLIYQLIGVKSPVEFIELSSAHARKRFEAFIEQGRHLTGVA